MSRVSAQRATTGGWQYLHWCNGALVGRFGAYESERQAIDAGVKFIEGMR